MNTWDNRTARASLWQMRHLEANWDSYGAVPIDGEAIKKALAMLDILQGPWSAVPCSDGSVQLEQHSDGFDIEVQISSAERREAPRG